MKKVIVLILAFIMVVAGMPLAVAADYTPPKVFGAPLDLTVHPREDGVDKTWQGFDATVSASEELRALVDVAGADNSPFGAAGYYMSDILLQLDYKVDNGSWRYQSNWDEDFSYSASKSIIRLEKGTYSNSAVFDKSQFESISDGGTLPADISYFGEHSMSFRTRFLVTYQDSEGRSYSYYSPWSETVTFSSNQKVEDPDKLIDHTPVLKSAELKKSWDGKLYFSITSEKPHEDLRTLNSISNNWLKTEVWLKVDKGEWKLCYTGNFYEVFDVSGMEAYFGLKENYSAAVYEIKFRYYFDYNYYPEAGKSGIIYSPFSNTIIKGMSAYSNASSWAKTELDKASEYGIIPESLKGADMTRPITREEFAELAVKLFEKTTGKAAEPVSPNPFSDTKNPEILKAFKVGVTTGTSATTFAPKQLTNREQVATMLSRAIRVMAPGGDFSANGAPVFNDQKDISSWALEHVKFMSKSGIIKGTNGKFMPKATTTAQIASGYATTTREMAIAMSVRAFEQFKPSAATAPAGSSAAPAASGTEKTSASGITGVWSTHIATGTPQDIQITYVFNSDGTYTHLVRSTYDYSCNAYKGNYKLDNGRIMFSNRSKVLFSYDKPDYRSLMAEAEKAGYKATEDEEKTIAVISGEEIKIVDLNYTRVKE